MNLENYPLWQSGVLHVAATDGTAVGSILDVTTFNLGRKLHLTAVVTENDHHAHYAVKSIQGPLTFVTSYDLQPAEGGMRLEFTCQIDTHAVFNLAGPALQAVAQTKNEADLRSLKILLEAAPEPQPEPEFELEDF